VVPLWNPASLNPDPWSRGREIAILLPNIQRQRHTCYALCNILYLVSASHMSIFRMNSTSTSFWSRGRRRCR
jgi:hypothetical protein